MNALEQFFLAYPQVRTAFDALSVILPLSALFAFTGLGFVSATARILSITRGRSSYEKGSRQLALLAVILGWTLLVGGRVWLHFTQEAHLPGTLNAFLVEMSWLLLSLGVLLSSVYFTLWRILRNLPILHVTLGMISAVQGCLATLAILATARMLASFAHPDAAGMGLQDLIPTSWDSPLWTVIAATGPLLLAMPAAFGAYWLLLRRTRDDFGRDHYNTMIPWCAVWARNAWAVLWLVLVVFTGVQIKSAWQGGGFTGQEAITESIRLLLWLVPVLLWTLVARSATPLRHKLALLAALVIAMSFTLPYFLELTRF